MEQVGHGLMIGLGFQLGKLPRPFVELRCHFNAFFSRGAHVLEDHLNSLQGKGRPLIGRIILREGMFLFGPQIQSSLARMVLTPTRFSGLLISPPLLIDVGVLPMASSTSSPLINSPKQVYWRSRKVASPRQMKN